MYLCVVTLLLIVLYTVNPIPVQTYTTAMTGPSRWTITGEVSCQINTLTPMFTDAVCQGTLIHIYNIQQRSNRTFYTFFKKLLVTLIHTTLDIYSRWQIGAMLMVSALTYLTVLSLPVLSTPAAVGSICVNTCSSILTWISFTFICVWKGKVNIQYEFIFTIYKKKFNIFMNKY